MRTSDQPRKPTASSAVAQRAPRVLMAVTDAVACRLIDNALALLPHRGFEVVVLASPGESLDRARESRGVQTIAVPMKRAISPFADLVSLGRVFRAIRKARPDLIDVGTPKAALLVGIAGWALRVPCRIYTLRGLRLETTTGLKRKLLAVTERISCACAHKVICNSPSLRDAIVELGIVRRQKTVVLDRGTTAGIDLEHFHPESDPSRSAALRRQLGIPENSPVIGFIGRMVRDKGIVELATAFEALQQTIPDVRLLLVGGFERNDAVPREIQEKLQSNPAIVLAGWVSDPAPYLHVMDVLALPTYREGFPGVSLQAQASGIPVVTTTATGARDSVVDGVSGLIVPIGNSDELKSALSKILCDPGMQRKMSAAGRQWVTDHFERSAVIGLLMQTYSALLCANLPATRERDVAPQIRPRRQRGVAYVGKRILDFVAAGVAALALSPVLLAIAIAILLTMGRPALFRQKRSGRFGRTIEICKFRTMSDARDNAGALLPDAGRITKLGTFLRNTSLDELPQLWNVLRGDISLVGPRPLLVSYLERYTPRQAIRLDVLPGVTGWAAIQGRNSISWEQKFEADAWYVNHWSFWLDLKILLLTVWKVLKREGISNNEHATMPEFLGQSSEAPAKASSARGR